MILITKVYIIEQNGEKTEAIYIHNSSFHLFITLDFCIRYDVYKFEFISGTKILQL